MVFGSQENERKKREKRAETGELKAFPPKFIMMLIDVHLLQTEAYICSEKGKLQNNMKQQNYSEGRKEKNQNGDVWIKNRSRKFSLCTVNFAIIAKIRYDSEISLS